MDRRNFLCRVTAASALGVAVKVEGGTPRKKETRSVKYQVKGFTCITCAVGLEVMLLGLKGVSRAKASYPENNVEIGFDGSVMSENMLKEFIATCGFSVA